MTTAIGKTLWRAAVLPPHYNSITLDQYIVTGTTPCGVWLEKIRTDCTMTGEGGRPPMQWEEHRTWRNYSSRFANATPREALLQLFNPDFRNCCTEGHTVVVFKWQPAPETHPFARRTRTTRKALGLTLHQFADVLGATDAMVTQWERGTATPNKIHTRLLTWVALAVPHWQQEPNNDLALLLATNGPMSVLTWLLELAELSTPDQKLAAAKEMA